MTTTKISELLALKIENLSLRLDALQSQAAALVEQRTVLLRQAQTETGASEDWAYNLSTRTFAPPPLEP